MFIDTEIVMRALANGQVARSETFLASFAIAFDARDIKFDDL